MCAIIMSPTKTTDDIMLGTLLKQRVKESGVSLRQVSRETDLSLTTILRVIEGGDIDIPTLIRISNWLGVAPSTVLDSMAPSNAGMIAKISALVEAEPKLAQLFIDAIQEIEKGSLTPAEFNDIVEYTTFKINLRRKQNVIKDGGEVQGEGG